MKIGERVKQLRAQKSQKEFAKLCGIDDTTISKIESGSLTGTLDVHRKISQALGLSLSSFYKGVYEEGIKPIETAPSAEEKPFFYHEKASSTFLTRNIFLNKKMLPELLVLEPNAEIKEELPADTQRFLYVLKGEIEVKVGNNTYKLKEANPLYILDASIPHSLKNTGSSKARVLRVTDPVRL